MSFFSGPRGDVSLLSTPPSWSLSPPSSSLITPLRLGPLSSLGVVCFSFTRSSSHCSWCIYQTQYTPDSFLVTYIVVRPGPRELSSSQPSYRPSFQLTSRSSRLRWRVSEDRGGVGGCPRSCQCHRPCVIRYSLWAVTHSVVGVLRWFENKKGQVSYVIKVSLLGQKSIHIHRPIFFHRLL